MSIIFVLTFWLSFLAFFWTYLGYPLLMWLRAKIAPHPFRRDESYLPALTLLIPAHNEADVIRRKLENAVSLDYPKDQLQILVIDDGSEDSTVDIVSEYESRGVTLIRQAERGGKMSAVNVGFERASGEIVVLSDASPSYEVHALRIIARPFSDAAVGVAVGSLAIWDSAHAVAKPAGLYWKYESALRRWESITGSTVAVHGNLFAIRHQLYKPLKPDTVNDEFSIAMEVIRQGYRVVYEPDAISYDDASATMDDEFKRRARINAGRYQALFSAGYLRAPSFDLTFRLFSHKLLRPLTPLFMVLMLIANPLALLVPNEASNALLMLRGGWGVLIFLAQLAFYGLAGLGWVAESQGRRSRLLSVPYYFVSSNFAALIGFWRWVRGSQRVTWAKRTADH